MTDDEIIRIAHECDCMDPQHYGTIWMDKLIRFARRISDAEIASAILAQVKNSASGRPK
jgi:hypothetical protein